MADRKGSVAGGGISLFTILGVVFIILKLCKVIAWPWLWVLCPFWIPLAIIVLVIGILLLGIVVWVGIGWPLGEERKAAI